MRGRIRVAGSVVVMLVAALLTGSTARADVVQPTTLYVSHSPCSDSGPGSRTAPFCTVQHAADLVNPGQTVMIINAPSFNEAVTVTRSGTPTAPIVFTGSGGAGVASGPGPAAVLTLAGVHDVRVTSLSISRRAG